MKTVLDTTGIREVRILFYFAVAVAIASGVFSLLYLGILLTNYYAPYRPDKLGIENSHPAKDPMLAKVVPFLQLPSDYPKFLELRERLSNDKTNEALKSEIRELDRKLRIAYFERRDIANRGTPRLMFAAILMFASARIAAVLRRRLPQPGNKNESKNEDGTAVKAAMYAIGIFAAIVLGIAIGFNFSQYTELEQFLVQKQIQINAELEEDRTNAPVQLANVNSGSGTQTRTGVEETPIDREAFLIELEKNWPSFRGPDGSGISRYDNVPLSWNVETGEGVVWKTEVPLPGHNSPLVWGDRLFLAGADENVRKVFCFNTNDGKLLWEIEAPSTPESAKPIEGHYEDTGYAAPSMVCDGKHAIAIFANCDVLAVDFEGNILWSKNYGIPVSNYGFSASLALYFDRVIVQIDQGEEKDGLSKIFALKCSDGSLVWETKRAIGCSWPSPIVRKVGERWQLITQGGEYVISYDPEDGKELWRCKCLTGDTGPSPTGSGDIVFAANEYPGLVALDGNSNGEISKEQILWESDIARPNACSPLADDKFAYTLEPYGYLGCNSIEQQENIWELEIGEGEASFYSSPSSVAGKILVFSKEDDGSAFVIDPLKAVLNDGGGLKSGTEADMIIATIPMGEKIFTSPAFADGRFYIRGEKHVFCIGK